MKINEISSKSIDSLRVICCLIVLTSHIYELTTGVLNNPFNEWVSFAAVGIFFFLSGYVNYISFKNKNDVLCVYDDRQKVVDMWREEGLVCCQVAPGNF